MPNQIGQAYYRIGPSDSPVLPSDLLADAATLNGQINLLDDQDMTKVSAAFFDAWNSFVSEWRGFYSSTLGSGSWFSALAADLNDSNRDQLVQFENRFATFAGQYQGETGAKLPGGIVNASSGAQDTLGQQLKNQLQPLIPSINATTVLIVVGVVVGAGLVYFFRRPLFGALQRGAG
jgi:hypothetical protein